MKLFKTIFKLFKKKKKPVLRKFGWKHDPEDHRDLKFKVSAPRDLPPLIDLRALCPPVYDQGQTGSCFVGETKIPLLNGNVRTLGELADGIEGNEFWVYSVLENGKIIPAKASASKTGLNREILKVVLDNGNEIQCTPEHKFMLRDGSYCEGKSLKIGQSLMPLKRKYSDRGYELMFDNVDTKWHYTHWKVKSFFEKRPNRDLIHHADFNKKNNSPENLIFMCWNAHKKLHAKLCEFSFKDWNGSEKQREHSKKLATEMHRKNPGWNLQGASAGGKNAWKKANDDGEMKKRMLSGLEFGRTNEDAKKKAIISRKKTYSTTEYKKKRSDMGKKIMIEHKKNNDDVWKNLVESGKKLGGINSLKYSIMKFGREILDNKKEINEMSWSEHRKSYSTIKTHNRIRNNVKQEYVGTYNNSPKYNTALNVFENIENLNDVCYNYNAKILSIEMLDKREDVYCLTVPEYHNFGLEAGVFVHNCTANALNAAYQFEEMKQGKENFMPSRLFVYYNERAIEGTIDEDAGAAIRDGIKTLVKDGVCPESMWVYNESKFAVKPTQDCYDAALNNQVLKYLSVSNTVQSVKECLAEGYPVVFGFNVYESFMSREVSETGMAQMPSRNEQQNGGHAIMAVGYDDSKEALIIRNSWGSSWGLNGYFYMPYGYITNGLSADFWIIRLVE